MAKTKLGKFSVTFIILFVLSFGIFQLLITSGQRGGATFFSNLYLTIPLLSMGIFGILSFFTGIISILKYKERAILVYLATIVGFFVLYFVLGELLFPH